MTGTSPGTPASPALDGSTPAAGFYTGLRTCTAPVVRVGATIGLRPDGICGMALGGAGWRPTWRRSARCACLGAGPPRWSMKGACWRFVRCPAIRPDRRAWSAGLSGLRRGQCQPQPRAKPGTERPDQRQLAAARLALRSRAGQRLVPYQAAMGELSGRRTLDSGAKSGSSPRVLTSGGQRSMLSVRRPTESYWSDLS